MLDKLIKIYEQGIPQEKDNVLIISHYSKADSIINILNSKVIWATDHRYLNDPEEVSYGKEEIIKILKSYQDKELAEVIKLLNKQYEKDCYHMLISSFVKHKDYLPCWRYYGDDGKGLSISFNRAKLEEGFKKRGVKSFFADVIYDEQQQSKFLQNLVKAYYKYKTPKDDLSSLIIILFLCLPIFKHLDWKDELECRIISPHIYMEKNNKCIPTMLPITKIVKDTHKLQYQLFNFEYYEIEKIVVGPCADFLSIKKRIISEFLKRGIVQIPFEIVKSEKKYSS